ncbi:DUF2442 domain-containing protein [Prosthecobacter vanneervenii]|uniref:DUF2442 domain-containing protein n=1 Tax=Prosthecobacter vanneervenii TaxID=48466 RepID=A0A7W8DMP9_9BACT|nr:DUF2442 domain-containing protein [Prosthecobacter vanneervenii]MBB5035507.1 hypothetical protein [Prosthecobacter vanneervenii]
MSTLNPDLDAPKALKVSFEGEVLHVLLEGGRQIVVPTALFPRLRFATKAERRAYRLIGGGSGIHWPALDEDISVKGLLAKKGSAESSHSLIQWLLKRKQASKKEKSSVQGIQILPPKRRAAPVGKSKLKQAV